jgi:uroporphyrinogen-III decarboxylase
LTRLMRKYQKGNRPAFNVGPFLPVVAVRERGFAFNDVFGDAEIMTATARMSLELGFESTVVPFDMNVEAEVLGAGVFFHEAVEGHPVYPTINHRPVARGEDVVVPGRPDERGPPAERSSKPSENSGRATGREVPWEPF